MKVTGLERVGNAERTLSDFVGVGGVFIVRGGRCHPAPGGKVVAVMPPGIGAAYFLRETGVTHSRNLDVYIVIGEVKEIEVK